MVADISYPDHETRVAILKTKLESQNNEIQLNSDILEVVSQKFPYNIRELEGALIRLLGILKIRKLLPTVENASSILDEINNHRIRMISPDNIIATVVEFYNSTEKEVLSHSRKKELVKPRQIIMYLLREDLKNSFSTIARKLGNRDHTTILHAYNKISRDIIKNKMLSQEINLIKEKIYNNK
jgi:chromosomal replication initiator protein